MPAAVHGMKKQVDVRDLALGMYVCELDRPWRETPFLFQGFQISSKEEIEALRRHCQYVYIETEIEDDPASQTRAWKTSKRATALHEETRERANLRVQKEPSPGERLKRVYQDQTTLEEEARAIRETHERAVTLIYTIMEDVQLGKSIDTAGAKRIVASMARSVLRNPDALVCFTHLKNKDDYTALHCLRVCILALALGRHLGFDEEDINLLGIGALLHDIGKMRVPSAILNKPGRLTEREFEIMKSHVPLGVEILRRTGRLSNSTIAVARLHHERYSGHGYMDNLKGDQISIFGLIGAIVDVYDAMTSDRIYREGISALDALKNMYERRWKDFHAGLVEQFIQCIGIFPIGSVVVLNSNEVGVVRTLNRTQRLKPQVALVLKPDKTRYSATKTIDLAETMTPAGKPYEIAKIVPPAHYGIRPVDYLPVMATA